VPERIGIIKRREPKELANKVAVVGIDFVSVGDWEVPLRQVSEQKLEYDIADKTGAAHAAMPMRMVVFPSWVTYSPLLSGLQSVRATRQEELFFGTHHAQRPSYVHAKLPTEMVSPVLDAQLQDLSSQQRQVLEDVLSQRTALVQVENCIDVGIWAVRVICEATEERMLCICDSESKADELLSTVLGENVDAVHLNQLKDRSDVIVLSSEQVARGRHLRNLIGDTWTPESLTAKVDTLVRECARRIGAKWWDSFGEFLQDSHPDEWRQLCVDEALNAAAASPRRPRDNDDIDVPPPPPDILWKRWLQNETPGEWAPGLGRQSFANLAMEPLWKLNRKQRDRQKLEWQREFLGSKRKQLATTIKKIQSARAELQALDDIKRGAVLSQVRVIVCTAAQAVESRVLLDEAASGVVMVSGADGVVDAQLLLSLNSECKHLILLGSPGQDSGDTSIQQLVPVSISPFARLAQTVPVCKWPDGWIRDDASELSEVWSETTDASDVQPLKDPTMELNELCQQRGLSLPEYHVMQLDEQLFRYTVGVPGIESALAEFQVRGHRGAPGCAVRGEPASSKKAAKKNAVRAWLDLWSAGQLNRMR
jgi:hypothetical protein